MDGGTRMPLDDERRDAVTGEQRGREHPDQTAAGDENRGLVLGHANSLIAALQGGLKTALYIPLQGGLRTALSYFEAGLLDGMNSRRLNFQPAAVFA